MNPATIEFNFTEIEVIKKYYDENTQINGDEVKFSQVLLNIINNAKDVLISQPTDARFLIINTYVKANKTIIEVCDNGGGIDEFIISKIFEPYFTTKHQSQGTGIGLFMCKEIINKHMNGQLNISNQSFEYKNKIYKGTLTRISLENIVIEVQ